MKGRLDTELLVRSIRYSVERVRVEKERGRLEQQLRQSQRMEVVGKLAGGLAHDFNNLLTAILGYSQMGATLVGPEGQVGTHLREINKAAQRASDLSRKLLAFSRGQITDLKVVTLNELILNTHKMLRRLIGEDIELVTVAAPDLGLVRVDLGQIEQVLINLAINARDATPSGGKLTIETENATVD